MMVIRLCVSHQMLIMLLFNREKEVTFKQIAEMTGLPKDLLTAHVLSLAHPKAKIILKKPMKKEVCL